MNDLKFTTCGEYMQVVVPSPCIRVCRLEGGVCVGCRRTQQEIAQWTTMTQEEQQLVLDRLQHL